MLQVPFIRENKALVIERLTKRNFDATNIVEDVIKLDEDRRKTQAQLDNVLSESNSLSKEIGNLFKSGEAQKANLLKEKTGQLKNQSKELEDTLNAISDALNELLYTIPNVPHESVPTGNTDEDNEEVFRAGDIPDLGVNALPHWELAKKYDIIDFELGNKIAGSGFPVYKGKGARLQRALIAYTPCFRVEAGSYGAHVRGLNRLHQFDKVEILRVEHPENSYNALEGMVEHIKGILEELKLPYRILRLCGGDLGFTSALTYDFEVFSTAQNRWLEISSVSNFETFQANRLKLRFKNKNGKNQLAHTLNGSSLALPRVLAGILENYQTEENIVIPEVLVPYAGFKTI